MGARRGFTVTELLFTIAIVAIVGAVLFPLFARSGQRSAERQCWSNLHRIQSALALYREERGDAGICGSAEQMGLPPAGANLPQVLHLPADVFHCFAPRDVLDPRELTYKTLFNDAAAQRAKTWSDYAAEAGERAVLVADMNHLDTSTPIVSPFLTHHVLAVRLSGQAFTFDKAGDWENLAWWPVR